MKKIFKKSNIFSFLLGAILFSGITGVLAYTMLAKDVSYTPNNTNWKVDNVKNALDDLYSKAKPDYTESTTVTPTESNQTLPTKDKILNNDITINAIPSTYKNLTTTTTASANTILSGYKAYDNSGNLITGTLSTECVSGSYVKPANSQAVIDFGFIPLKISLMYTLNSSKRGVIYDANVSSNFYVINDLQSTPTAAITSYFQLDDHYLKSVVGKPIQSYPVDISYMACK